MYLVPSEATPNLFYFVNNEVLLCTCFHGNTGRICKHIDWVNALYPSNTYERVHDDLHTRTIFYKVATGADAPTNWLLPLTERNIVNATENEEPTSSIIKMSDTDTDFHGNNDHDISGKTIENDKKAVEEGKKIIMEMATCFTTFLTESPVEVLAAVQSMLEKTKKLTVNAFVSSCMTFSSGK